jgi:hypothetical protein
VLLSRSRSITKSIARSTVIYASKKLMFVVHKHQEQLQQPYKLSEIYESMKLQQMPITNYSNQPNSRLETRFQKYEVRMTINRIAKTTKTEMWVPFGTIGVAHSWDLRISLAGHKVSLVANTVILIWFKNQDSHTKQEYYQRMHHHLSLLLFDKKRSIQLELSVNTKSSSSEEWRDKFEWWVEKLVEN